MATQVTIADARDQLSAHVRNAEHGTPVVITRRGRAVAVIVAAGDYEQLERLRAAGPQAGLAGLRGTSPGSAPSSGMRLPDADLQIAATALHHGLDLVTGNLKHVACVPDLTIRPLRSSA